MIPITVFCSSRVDPQYVLWAFKNGADGVFIGGCHPRMIAIIKMVILRR